MALRNKLTKKLLKITKKNARQNEILSGIEAFLMEKSQISRLLYAHGLT